MTVQEASKQLSLETIGKINGVLEVNISIDGTILLHITPLCKYEISTYEGHKVSIIKAHDTRFK